MTRQKELNKMIISKIKDASASAETKEFLMDVFLFERDYFNEDLNRFSAHYTRLAEHHIKKIGGNKK